jgi:hypothetical protein
MAETLGHPLEHTNRFPRHLRPDAIAGKYKDSELHQD